MEALRKIPSCAIFLILVIFSAKSSDGASVAITDINEENWSTILKNEWMVEFMAPWCPACSSLRPTWQKLAGRARDLGIKVGEVDVTTSPGLSGRFLVTALPTIYHVTDGEFRQYTGPRDEESLVSFVSGSKWRALPLLPWYRDPSQPHMALLSHFFRLSQVLRSIHNTLLETYGLPTWGSYTLFAVATIFVGALLGLIVVCMIDYLFPPKVSYDRKRQAEKTVSKTELNLLNQDLVDEDEEKREAEGEDEVDDSDAERNSASDSLQSSESEEAEEDEEEESKVSSDKEKKDDGTSSPGVRKRKPRKAD